MQPGDIAFKGSFAYGEPHHRTDSTSLTTSQDENRDSDSVVFIVKKRRCDPLFHEWGVPLCDDLTALSIPNFPEVQIAVKHATEHRCGFRIRSPYTLSDNIDSMDPLKDHLPLLRAKARTTSQSRARMDESDINKTEILTPTLSTISKNSFEQWKSSPSSPEVAPDNGTKYGLVSLIDLRQTFAQNDKSALDLSSADELLEKYLSNNRITPEEYDDRVAIYTADVVNAVSETCQKYLENHPIILERKRKNLPITNLVLLRACGKLTKVCVKAFKPLLRFRVWSLVVCALICVPVRYILLLLPFDVCASLFRHIFIPRFHRFQSVYFEVVRFFKIRQSQRTLSILQLKMNVFFASVRLLLQRLSAALRSH